MQKITPFLWFNDNAEEAVKYYASVFKDSKILHVSRYEEANSEVSGIEPGKVMTVNFMLNGQEFVALNGGPIFQFNESISFVINCVDQEEVDHYWNKLSKGGDEKAQQCGWLKDKFGVSWQVVPIKLGELMSTSNGNKVMEALLKMKKINIQELEEAASEA